MPRGQPPSETSKQKLRTQITRGNKYVDEANAGDATNYNREVKRENKLVSTRQSEADRMLPGLVAKSHARGQAAKARKPSIMSHVGRPTIARGLSNAKLLTEAAAKLGSGGAKARPKLTLPEFAKTGRVSANVVDERLPLAGGGEKRGRGPKKRPGKK